MNSQLKPVTEGNWYVQFEGPEFYVRKNLIVVSATTHLDEAVRLPTKEKAEVLIEIISMTHDAKLIAVQHP